MSAPLSCPVRHCALPLERDGGAWTCPRGHSFDVARSGYVNLLQPQDRRSADAGDSRASIEARAALLAAGIGAAVLDAVVASAAGRVPSDGATVVDLGCGSGDALGRLHARTPITGVGIDLSAFAVDRAARRYPALTWIVANADRRLPLLDGCVSLALSLHARRNPAECGRVIVPGGHLLVAVPAHDDLVELREAVMGARVERERTEAVIAEHAPSFELVDRLAAREHHDLTGAQLREVLRGTYRGERSSVAERVQALDGLRVTFASELAVFRRR